MAIRSGIFNSVNGDRKYTAESFAEYFSTFISNGIFPTPTDGLKVIANNDMTVTLKTGKGFIYGYYIFNDDNYNMVVDVADGVLSRIDRVVLQLNYLNREILPVIKKGTIASSPVAPSLQRDSDVYELGIADILVSNGAVNISQASITDTRSDESLCGIVKSLVDGAVETMEQQLADLSQTFSEHKAEKASLTEEGHVQLSSATDSTDETKASTPNALKQVNDALLSHIGSAPKVVSGSYTGNNTANRIISVGFTPKLVIVQAPSSASGGNKSVWISIKDLSARVYDTGAMIVDSVHVTTNGFLVGKDASSGNGSYTYQYTAIG